MIAYGGKREGRGQQKSVVGLVCLYEIDEERECLTLLEFVGSEEGGLSRVKAVYWNWLTRVGPA
jgi:hypothetical protein